MDKLKPVFRESETFDTEPKENNSCGCSKITGYGDTQDSFREYFSVECSFQTCFWVGLDHKHCTVFENQLCKARKTRRRFYSLVSDRK